LLLALVAVCGVGQQPARAQSAGPAVVVSVPEQVVERFEAGDGGDLGSWVAVANISIGADGMASGETRLTMQGSQIYLYYMSGQVTYDKTGAVIRIDLGGQGIVTDAVGKQQFTFTASVSPKAGDPDDLVFDIVGGDVYDGVKFEVKGTLTLVAVPPAQLIP
jgi:hypothetical protein